MKAKKLTKETILSLGMTERKFPQFGVGDTVEVNQRIVEGDKERIQAFEGDVIAIRHHGIASTFTVRKIGANAVSVERIFPYYSPRIESINCVKRGRVRRAKLYYMRGRVGKAARVTERVITRAEKEQKNEA